MTLTPTLCQREREREHAHRSQMEGPLSLWDKPVGFGHRSLRRWGEALSYANQWDRVRGKLPPMKHQLRPGLAPFLLKNLEARQTGIGH